MQQEHALSMHAGGAPLLSPPTHSSRPHPHPPAGM